MLLTTLAISVLLAILVQIPARLALLHLHVLPDILLMLSARHNAATPAILA